MSREGRPSKSRLCKGSTLAMTSSSSSVPPTSKSKSRSKVFSGTVRNSSQSHIPSLLDLCIQVLMDNHQHITYIGDAPFWLLKPVLAKCTPAQLLFLENLNPRLTEDDDELWEWHCRREFKDYERLEDESWRELYTRAEIDRKRKLERITHKIDMKEKSKGPVRKVKVAYANDIPKPPRSVLRLQEKAGTSASSTSHLNGTHSTKNSRVNSNPSSQPAKKQKGSLMKNALKMMQSIRRQNY